MQQTDEQTDRQVHCQHSVVWYQESGGRGGGVVTGDCRTPKSSLEGSVDPLGQRGGGHQLAAGRHQPAAVLLLTDL